MKKWILQNKLYIIGAVLGAMGGYLYWLNIGCVTGTCAITSDPTRSTLYFALMGALSLGLFKNGFEKKGIESVSHGDTEDTEKRKTRISTIPIAIGTRFRQYPHDPK